MFTDEQIAFMISLGLDLDFNNLKNDDEESWSSISEVLEDRLCYADCFKADGEPTSIGIMCEEILDLIVDM